MKRFRIFFLLILFACLAVFEYFDIYVKPSSSYWRSGVWVTFVSLWLISYFYFPRLRKREEMKTK